MADKKQSYQGWEDKQCETCSFCVAAQNGGIACDVFLFPYFVWGQYVYHSHAWHKREKEKPSPTTCWAFCGTQEEYKKRICACEVYGKK